MNKLQDRVVVITGASSGIGRATALKYAREGANLVLAARRKQVLKEVAEECERHGSEAIVVETDVSNENEVENLAKKALVKLSLGEGHMGSAVECLVSTDEPLLLG